jgi:hypothetical protein
LTPELKEFLNLRNTLKVEYLLMGGYAVALYGFVRPTKDIDLWAPTGNANMERIKQALLRFGFSPQTIDPGPLFTGEKNLLRMGPPPNRLELLAEIPGIQFEECFSRRKLMEIDGVGVPVIDLSDLLKNKRATGRDTDVRDVDRMRRGHRAGATGQLAARCTNSPSARQKSHHRAAETRREPIEWLAVIPSDSEESRLIGQQEIPRFARDDGCNEPRA